MSVRVLLVDDSAVIRGLMTKALAEDPTLEVVATAANGAMAIDSARTHQPDIIVLDIEMPVMDGITALPELLKASPHCRIIMASTLTQRNAEISLKALELGAADYLAKPSSKFGNEVEEFYRELIAKIKALGASAQKARPANSTAAPSPVIKPAAPAAPITPNSNAPHMPGIKALAIASSTGGPQALQAFFEQIKGRLTHIPIFITQHMPPTFTAILAEHITKAGGRKCREADEGMVAVAGEAYIAKGDYHMLPQMKDGAVKLHITQDPPENFCRPAADPMLRALSNIYGDKLAVLVLTGMGQDGMEGAKVVLSRGGMVVAQNEETCVVYGMPKAVVEKNLCKAVLPLPHIGQYLIHQIEGR